MLEEEKLQPYRIQYINAISGSAARVKQYQGLQAQKGREREEMLNNSKLCPSCIMQYCTITKSLH